MAQNRSNNGLLDRAQGLAGGRRIVLLIGTAVVILGIWWLGRWASEPTFVTLY
ncbi:MAG: hypothetical protein GF346_02370, partial [Candidatus Eisenbacteria bacterium]|nr:hypothetical protein [Candidatus Latescibacterota bacterium]MBD3301273.1 hypothetical protein [Candidatus Eisenbacteria bacterium]